MLRKWPGRKLLMACVIAAIVATFCVWLGRARPPAVPDLPSELDRRAELLARAWLSRDLATMRRLTSTTHDRVLYAWTVRYPPPPLSTGGTPAQAQFRVLDLRPHQATVAVSLSGLASAESGGAVELRQDWVERENIWYFMPPDPSQYGPVR
jgi:hypothetical protein